MGFSNTFFEAVSVAASKLDDDHPTIRLGGIFGGFYVTLNVPEIDPTRYETMQFDAAGIEREGCFYLVMESLWGKPKA